MIYAIFRIGYDVICSRECQSTGKMKICTVIELVDDTANAINDNKQVTLYITNKQQ